MALLTFAGIPAAQHADAHPKHPGQQPPNIVLIHLDDMGYGDLTATGATGYRTPNIDRLCAEGMRFTNYYSAQAVSSASRAGLLTGCYPNRIGFAGALGPKSKTGLNPDEETMAENLKKAGYATAIVGKWHVGCRPGLMPLDHGFDEYFGLPYSNDMWPHHPQTSSYRRCRCTKGARSSTRRSRPRTRRSSPPGTRNMPSTSSHAGPKARSSSTWPTPCRTCRSSSRTSSRAKASRDCTAT